MQFGSLSRWKPSTARRAVGTFGIGSALIGAAAIAALPAWAADDQAAAQVAEGGAASARPAEAAGQEIEDVIVTATKRKEPLQKVPVAVSVVEGDQAAQQNLNNINDISSIVPSLNFRNGASNKDQGLVIRGMGTVTTSPGVEPSVSTVVDGVPLDRPGQATLDLLDVDRIEVLRGPQGTLFGKNASAGAVNIVTKQPTEEVQGYADVSYFGGGDEVRAKAGISGALVPGKAKGLLSVLTSDYGGNVTNVYNGDKVNGYDHNGARAKIELTPSDNLRALLAVDYLRSRETIPTGVISSTNITYPNGVSTPYPALAGLIAPVGASSSNRDINANTNSYADDDNGGVSGQLDWSIGDYTLTSISAYRKWKNRQIQDFDRTSSPLSKQIVDDGNLDFDQYSEELRITSPTGKFLEYVAGLYYLHAVDDEVYKRTDSAAGIVNNGTARYGTTNNNYSVFGEATLNFTDSFRGIAGARLIEDDLGYYHSRAATAADTGINPSSPYATGDTSDLGYADRFGLQYDVNRSATAYVTYSHGYKGPAYNVFFNMVPSTQGAALKAETSDSYEIGLKTKTLEDRLLLNVALFDTTFDNYQANFPNLVNGAVVTNLVNAGTVSSRGFEADFTVKPTQALTLSGNLAATDAKIDHALITPKNWPINGEPLPFTPKWKSNLRGEYRIPVTEDYEIDLGTDYRWQSKVQYDLSESPDTIQKAYGIWDADLSLNNLPGAWRVSVLAKNLLNKNYSSYLQSSGATSSPGTPGYVYRWIPRDVERYFGVALRKEF